MLPPLTMPDVVGKIAYSTSARILVFLDGFFDAAAIAILRLASF
jgi:hypothetical protein